MCVATLAWTAFAHASPASDATAKRAQAERLYNAGQYEQALAIIEQGLAIVPAHTGLLELKGQVLIKLPDYLGALEAYEADVAAGAVGSNLRNARINIATLAPVRTTFLDITASNGPAVIHLDSRTQRVLCTAEPTCHQGWLPGAYKVLADRPGYQPWSGQVTLVAGKTTTLAIALVEKPSALTVRVAQADAKITVDDVAYSAPTTIPAGSHRVAVQLAGHVTSSTEIVARGGKPVELEISLTPRVAIQVEPASAALRLDGQPILVEDGGLGVPPGHHVLVARAPGLAERRIDIPAERPDGYAIVVRLSRSAAVVTTSRWTPRRKLAVVAGGVGVVVFVTGAVLGSQAKQREDAAFALCPSPTTPCTDAAEATDLNKQGQSRALQANVAYGVAAGAVVAAAVLWFTGAPESRVAVTPRLGEVAGLDLSLRF
ncbi:MAG: hypothetical protein ABIY55_08910 [Kofleriaceae bacterium]